MILPSPFGRGSRPGTATDAFVDAFLAVGPQPPIFVLPWTSQDKLDLRGAEGLARRVLRAVSVALPLLIGRRADIIETTHPRSIDAIPDWIASIREEFSELLYEPGGWLLPPFLASLDYAAACAGCDAAMERLSDHQECGWDTDMEEVPEAVRKTWNVLRTAIKAVGSTRERALIVDRAMSLDDFADWLADWQGDLDAFRVRMVPSPVMDETETQSTGMLPR